MIFLPLYLPLMLYALFLIVFSLFMAVNIYHISESASFTIPSFIMTSVIAFLTLTTLIITIVLLKDVNWTEMLPLIEFSSSNTFIQ